MTAAARGSTRAGQVGAGYDVVVVGAGVAGAALAESLAARSDLSVLVCEAGDAPGLHSSGRSVAVVDPLYGNADVQVLSAASRDRLDRGVLDDGTLLSPRDLIEVARPGEEELLDAAFPPGSPGISRLDADDLVLAFPAVRLGALVAGLAHLDGADLDVGRLHADLLTSARRGGVTLVLGTPVRALIRSPAGRWRVDLGDRSVEAGVVVDAAGAWADDVARMAGAAPLGITPLRRTVGVVPRPDATASGWAMLAHVGSRWYVKPDGASLLLSPADAVPVDAGDPRADEVELARAIEEVNEVTTLEVRRITRTWAGLRTYAPDERPLIGFDADVEGFFWQAAFGGFGLQTCLAAGRLAADLVLGQEPHLDPRPFAPSRLDGTV